MIRHVLCGRVSIAAPIDVRSGFHSAQRARSDLLILALSIVIYVVCALAQLKEPWSRRGLALLALPLGAAVLLLRTRIEGGSTLGAIRAMALLNVLILLVTLGRPSLMLDLAVQEAGEDEVESGKRRAMRTPRRPFPGARSRVRRLWRRSLRGARHVLPGLVTRSRLGVRAAMVGAGSSQPVTRSCSSPEVLGESLGFDVTKRTREMSGDDPSDGGSAPHGVRFFPRHGRHGHRARPVHGGPAHCVLHGGRSFRHRHGVVGLGRT